MKTFNIFKFSSSLIVIVFLLIKTTVFSQDNSNFNKPHDVNPEGVYATAPAPLVYNTDENSVVYTNVDISANTAPQNEPTVRISHKLPNRVVAAWRDFRIGVTPAVRRVGYSYSTNGG